MPDGDIPYKKDWTVNEIRIESIWWPSECSGGSDILLQFSVGHDEAVKAKAWRRLARGVEWMHGLLPL